MLKKALYGSTSPLKQLLRGLGSAYANNIAGLWVWAQPSQPQALTDLKSGIIATPTGSPSFAPNQGFNGNGSSAFLNLGIAPSALPSFVTDNNIFIAHYARAIAAGDALVTGSNDGASHYSYILGPYSDSKIYPRLGDPSAAGTLSAGGAGFYYAGKSSSTTAVVSRNAVSLGTTTIVSGARSTANAYTLGENNNGTLSTPSESGTRVAVTVMGAHTTGLDALLWSVFHTYLTTVAPGQF